MKYLKDQNGWVIITPNTDYRHICLYLKTYGPTKEELEWTEDKHEAFIMPLESIERRLPIVQEWFPNATCRFT